MTGLVSAADAYAFERERLAAEITAMARETGPETGRTRFADAVMAAMHKVPRHRFVSPGDEPFAYENRPLPIGEGQTISQPYIVALMTELLDPRPEHDVLEVGTGSGYQTAVLAETGARVYTLEVVDALARRASELLVELGYANVTARTGDGYEGWPEHAPFDSIIVTAAASDVPQPLVNQLKAGGRLVIPVGGAGDVQHLLLVDKRADGTTARRRTLPVRFVPLVRARGKIAP
ncbi:MAG TPA: protein-L-isoaspartate(D-aspartate) O-methyltransferase [Burkholderiales bacterium]